MMRYDDEDNIDEKWDNTLIPDHKDMAKDFQQLAKGGKHSSKSENEKSQSDFKFLKHSQTVNYDYV